MFRNFAFALALLAPSLAFGQATVQQTATRLDASSFNQSNGNTACTTVNSTQAANTVTITPNAGQYAYITGVYIDAHLDATGVAAPNLDFTTTNITGSPVWGLSEVLMATAGVQANYAVANEVYTPPLKSAQPGVAVTIVGPAQTAHVAFCMRVTGYFAP